MTEEPKRRRRVATPDSVAAVAEPTWPGANSVADAADADRKTRAAGIVGSAEDVLAGKPFGTLPVLGGGYDRIQETIFFLPDPHGEYAELEKSLMLGTREFESVSKALDCSEDNARRAHKLYVNARVDYERFNTDADIIEAAMTMSARADLEHEKASGQRSKQITDGDVKAKTLVLYPDEYRDLLERRVKGRKMLDHLERLADLWRTRCFSLAKQLEARR